MFNPRPEILAKYLRGTLVEEEHYGFRMLADNDRVIEYSGETGNYPFYLNSCANPLIASLIIDYGMDVKYDMTLEEIAISCSSHTAENLHIELEKSLLNKIGVDEKSLKCGVSRRLPDHKYKDVLFDAENESVLQNGCAAKHIMMLGLCKMNGWNMENYDNLEHPLQVKIKEKIIDLCRLKHRFPITKDFCGLPAMSMPLENVLWGYLKIFTDPRYQKISEAFLNYPDIIGGKNRLDTKIIKCSDNIIAKASTCGICVVVNVEKQEALVVKISDSNMDTLEAVVVKSLNNLHWTDIPFEYLIKTFHNEIVGEIVVL